MAKLELFAGDSSLIFEIRDERTNWAVVIAKTKEGEVRLGAESFKTIKKNALLALKTPYTLKKSTTNTSEDNKFRIFPLMDPHAGVYAEPLDDGILNLLWLQWINNPPGYTSLMSLTPEEIQTWIHALKSSNLDKIGQPKVDLKGANNKNLPDYSVFLLNSDAKEMTHSTAKLELFAGDNSLIFEISKNAVKWSVVYAKSKDATTRLGAMDFKTLKRGMLLKLPPPYSPKKSFFGEFEYNMFYIFNLMDSPSTIYAEPNDNEELKLLWIKDAREGFTHLMTLSPKDVQAWIHTIKSFEIDEAKDSKNWFKRRRT